MAFGCWGLRCSAVPIGCAVFWVYPLWKHGAEDVGIDSGPVEFAAFEQKAAGAGYRNRDGFVCLGKAAVDGRGIYWRWTGQGFRNVFRGVSRGLEKCRLGLRPAFSRRFYAYGLSMSLVKPFFGEDFWVSSAKKKQRRREGQKTIGHGCLSGFRDGGCSGFGRKGRTHFPSRRLWCRQGPLQSRCFFPSLRGGRKAVVLR